MSPSITLISAISKSGMNLSLPEARAVAAAAAGEIAHRHQARSPREVTELLASLAG